MKEAVHKAHLGVESGLRRARECMFWPGMSAELKQHISQCESCRTFEISNPLETLMSHDLPVRPWEKVGTDLLEWQGKNYLVTVDYLSNFWEIDRLYSTTSQAVISKLKTHFARHGIPTTVVSDNGPQYISKEFQQFTQNWDFEHLTSSPYNSKANGKAESAVKAAKKLLNKTNYSKTDPYMALLELRNTPTQAVGSSPAQRLLGRRTRSFLPTTSTLLEPRGAAILQKERDRMKDLQRKQAFYHNTSAKDLPVLEEGDTVRMKHFQIGKKTWDKGTITQRLDERSYEVETSGGVYRRNRCHLKKSNETPLDLDDHQPPLERPTRPTRRPEFLKDYVC